MNTNREYGKGISAGRLILILIVFFAFAGVCGCQPSADIDNKTTTTRLLMDTRVDLTLYGADKKTSDQVAEAVFSEMERLENMISRTIPTSELNKINMSAGKEWVKVEPELFFLLQKALEVSVLSGGAFDPTVAPLIELWGFGGDHPQVPSEEDLQKLLPLVDYKLVEMDEESFMVYLPVEGMKLDLGGIAKGFIVDRGLETASQFGLQSFFINAGGDISMSGVKPSGEKWVIAVQDPKASSEATDIVNNVAVLWLEGDGSVVTSGDYQRYFEENGVKYHHILDPENGKPARRLSSVTIVADNATVADALSTASFVLGKEKGLSLLESMPGIDGIFVDPEGNINYTSGLEGRIELIKN